MVPMANAVKTKSSRKLAAAPKARDRRYFSKVVGKALDLLELVEKSPRPLSLNELTRQVGLAKSSVFRILYTLESAGYINRNEAGQYYPSNRIKSWISGHLVEEVVRVALPKMLDLRRRFRETVSLAVVFENHIEVVEVVESPQLIRMGNTVGRIIPPHASSLGKAITAFQSEPRRETLLRSYGLHRFTERTITDELELARELESVRRAGWACDQEESTSEGFCFGAPILLNGEAVAAMSISIPETRLPDKAGQKEITTALVEATREVAAELERVLSVNT